MMNRSLHQVKAFSEPKERSDYLPAGIVFIVLLGVLGWIFVSVPPASFKDVLVRDAFLPLIPLFLLCFGTGLLFLTASVRRAIMWPCFLTILVWLQLQHVLDLLVFVYILFPFAFVEFILTVSRER